jgi:thiamine pyrophosphokinase
MSRCVIVGGADINGYDKVKGYFLEDDYFIFCDSGLKHKDILALMRV